MYTCTHKVASAYECGTADTKGGCGPISQAELCAHVVAHGPIVAGLALTFFFKDPMSWRWPFQNERILGGFGLFVFLGWITSVFPIYWAIKLGSKIAYTQEARDGEQLTENDGSPVALLTYVLSS